MKTGARLLIAALAAGIAGCSTIVPAELEPIASRNESLFGQVQFDLRLEDVILLNYYLDQQTPKTDAFNAARTDLYSVAELLIEYSNDLLQLAHRDDDDDVLIGVFMRRIRGFYERVSQVPGVERYLARVDIDAIALEAAEQKNWTGALRIAAPVYESIANAIHELIVEADDLLDEAMVELSELVLNEFAPFSAYGDNLWNRQNGVLEELLLLDSARDGDTDSWRSLLSEDEPLRRRLGADAPATAAAIEDAEAFLVARLASLTTTWGYLEPTFENYQAVMRELYAAEANANRGLQLASFIIYSWADAQAQLARGQRAPFIAVTQDLLGVAVRGARR